MAQSYLYLLPAPPLNTVYEVESSPEQTRQGHDLVSAVDRVSWAPARLHRKALSNGRSEHRLSQSPHALLHNDWYLNQLFNDVWNLYKPGAISGVSAISRVSGPSQRSTSLLQILAPDSQIAPLATHPCTLCENSASDEPVLQYATYREPAHYQALAFRASEPLLSTMPPKRKAAKGKAGDSPAKIRRSNARKDLLHDEKHVFSAKTKLANEDLTAILSNPQAWSILSDEEKETVRSLMPADMVYTEDGAPDPQFLRYDNDWRNGLRLFSEDLQNGRYEPEWLEAAQEAAEMRRRGDFDSWKEEQFEEHWGQKSDAHADLMAGEAVKIRLPEMIKAGIFRVGDVLSYARAFGVGKNGFLVEKNPIVVEITGQTMTFTMAHGTHRTPPPDMAHPPDPLTVNGVAVKGGETNSTPELHNGQNFTIQVPQRSVSSEARCSPEVSVSPSNFYAKRSSSLQPQIPSVRVSTPVSNRNSSAEAETSENGVRSNKKRFGSFFGSLRRASLSSGQQKETALKRKPVSKMEIVHPTVSKPTEEDSDSPLSSLDEDEFASTPKKTPVSRKPAHTTALKDELQSETRNQSTHESSPQQNQRSPHKSTSKLKHEPDTLVNGSQSSEHVMSSIEETTAVSRLLPSHTALVTIEAVDSLHTLEQKILEVDGRRKGEPRANAWRTFRCKRGTEDIGTLWDMREDYYKRKHA